jgi:uncharacterized protein YjiS (DUF1127 family)
MITTTVSSPTARRSRAMTLLMAGLRAVANRRRRRRSYLALMELNDHMLKDIGVSRGEIHAATVERRPIRRLSG